MKTKSELIDKIKKLLAVSNCKNANPNEAAIALRQAQALMRQYNITGVDIAAAEITETTSRCRAKKIYPTWLCTLASTIANGFGSRAFFSAGTVIFMGCGNDPEFAKYAFDVLHRQCLNARKMYIANYKAKRTAADTYCAGWVYSATKLISNIITDDTQNKISVYLDKKYGIKSTLPAITRKKSLEDVLKNDDDAMIAFMHGDLDGKKAILNRGVHGSEVQKIGGIQQ